MKRELLGVGSCVAVSTALLYLAALSLSRRIGQDVSLTFPLSLDQLKTMAGQLQAAKELHYYHIVLVFSLAYLYKQAFAIPGSFLLNLLAGALFGVWVGLPLACLLTACGATISYTLSLLFGRRIVLHHLGHRIAPLKKRLSMEGDGGSLLLILLSLRLFPMSPNWLLNITSPHLGVPPHLFFISVLIGLVPYNYLSVQAGLLLSEMDRLSGVMDMETAAILLLATVCLLATALCVRKFRTQKSVHTQA